MKKKRLGYVRVNPSDYVIRFRKGKIHREGRGMSFFCMPREQYVIIPSVANSITFVADQITKENQGVEVSGFTIWHIKEPTKVYTQFDFYETEAPLRKIDEYLKDVVESAIRHMVSNMTIEEVLRKRGTIILQLKKELEYICQQWGLEIDTIEIKEVHILSETLFSNMQATFRNAILLESETSTLQTQKEIAEKRIRQKEEIALAEQQSKLQELSRQDELRRKEIAQSVQIAMMEQEKDMKIQTKEEENKRLLNQSRLETRESELAIERRNLEARLEETRKKAEISQIELHVQEENIRISNAQDHNILLYKQLPQILGALKISNLNLGDDRLREILNQLLKSPKTRE